jgi:hypothetical protein
MFSSSSLAGENRGDARRISASTNHDAMTLLVRTTLTLDGDRAHARRVPLRTARHRTAHVFDY